MKNYSLILFLIYSFVLNFSHCDEVISNVIVLGPSNFTDLISKSDFLVEFYAPCTKIFFSLFKSKILTFERVWSLQTVSSHLGKISYKFTWTK